MADIDGLTALLGLATPPRNNPKVMPPEKPEPAARHEKVQRTTAQICRAAADVRLGMTDKS